MGRTLKRVPLDFSWPLDQVWEGYLNPHWKDRADCAACSGTGYSPEAKRFHDEWYGKAPFDPVVYGAKPLTFERPAVVAFAERNCQTAPEYYGNSGADVAREARRLFSLWKGMWCHHLIQADVDALVVAERLWDFTHVPLNDEQRANRHENGWTKEPNGHHPTADEVNAWSFGGFGHDSINSGVCVRSRCERAGLTVECVQCGGHGDHWPSAGAKAQCEAWTSTEPPTGDGYQLWETTTEGSPQSPVFATLYELSAWCADNATTFGSKQASAQSWHQMLSEDSVRHEHGNMVFT